MSTTDYTKPVRTGRRFRALGLNFTDQTIMSFVENFQRNGHFTSVIHIAEQICMTRPHVNTRLTALMDLGWLQKMAINGRRVLYTLTQKAYDTISLFLKQKAEEKQERIRKKNERDAEIKAQMRQVNQAAGEEPEAEHEAPKPAAPSDPYGKEARQTLFDYFRLDPDLLAYPDSVIRDGSEDYVDFMQGKGKTPAKDGCRNRIQAAMTKSKNGAQARQRAMKLDQAKNHQAEAIVNKIDNSTKNINGNRKTTNEKLTNTEWAVGLD